MIIAVVGEKNKEIQAREYAEKLYSEGLEFAGVERCAYYKMRYVFPYEQFVEIKKLILRVNEAKGLRYDYRGVVVVDISEWLEHMEEEFFDIFLKYVADNMEHKKYVFAITEKKRENLSSVIERLLSYFVVKVEQLDKQDNIQLKDKIMRIFKERDIITDEKLTDMLVYTIEQLPNHNENTIETILEDLLDYCQNNKLNTKYFLKYVADKNTILGLMLPQNIKVIGEEKRDERCV